MSNISKIILSYFSEYECKNRYSESQNLALSAILCILLSNTYLFSNASSCLYSPLSLCRISGSSANISYGRYDPRMTHLESHTCAYPIFFRTSCREAKRMEICNSHISLASFLPKCTLYIHGLYPSWEASRVYPLRYRPHLDHCACWADIRICLTRTHAYLLESPLSSSHRLGHSFGYHDGLSFWSLHRTIFTV